LLPIIVFCTCTCTQVRHRMHTGCQCTHV
jgi:hypothetical protein